MTGTKTGLHELRRIVEVAMLDLTQLAHLPGPAATNFEALTRSIVTRRFAALGPLRERRQQPGVEFFLPIERDGELGKPGRVWGWSCKWFLLGANNELSATQRSQIEDSVGKAVKHVAGLSDFVLCLPQRPTKKDLDWIYGLGTHVNVSIHLWAGEDFDVQLAGFDILRSTFFGELVLTPEALMKAHQSSVAPVASRWLLGLHTTNHVQRQLERMLLRPTSFDWLEHHIEDVALRIETLRSMLDVLDNDVRAIAETTTSDLLRFLADVRVILTTGRSQRPFEVLEHITNLELPSTSPRQLRALVLRLRKMQLPAALVMSGVGAEIRDIVALLQKIQLEAKSPLIAVVGAAGQGKTHLSAQLTSPTDQPTAGVFILGSRLRSGGNFDEITKGIPSLNVERFEDLLESLNSAGLRAGVRIPLVVDGLNEAERPTEWRQLLDELVPILRHYPQVAMIVTLREALAGHAIPHAATRIDLDWQDEEVDDLINAYFDHYKIDASNARLPRGLFDNPLFLRMYCEAANPRREFPVGVESLPTSLVGVFELYRKGVVDRLANDPARVHVPADEIKRRIAEFALELWKRNVRRMPYEDSKALLDKDITNWHESLFRRLEEEGVLVREDIEGHAGPDVGIVFDRFAGYLVADALLSRMPLMEVTQHLADVALWNSLLGENSHSLGEDVAIGLIGLLPRRFAGQHLWRAAPDSYRPGVLAQELHMESDLLDEETIDELRKLIVGMGQPKSRGRHPFDRLWEIRMSRAHRLNACFLDTILRSHTLPGRDSSWTEWIRRNEETLVNDLNEIVDRWSAEFNRSEEDALEALAVNWLLSSTNKEVRDLATKALQRYGKPDPKNLFNLATRMLDVNDPYIVERTVAAALGAATTRQMPDPGGTFEHGLAVWLVELRDHYLSGGSSPTSHEMLRSYVRATFEFAGILHPAAVPAGTDPFALDFAQAAFPSVMTDEDPNFEECARTLHMDFENYVIGHLFDDRRNYDYEHEGFQYARSEVLARVWELGWRDDLFGLIDKEIADARGFRRGQTKVERYGKKYGWIAYYELVGRLADAGELSHKWVGGGRYEHIDIDPSFPDEPPVVPFLLPEWAPASPADDESWLRTGVVNVPSDLLAPESLYGDGSGWILAEGFLEHKRDGRSAFGFFRTILLDQSDVESALKLIKEREYLGNGFFPDVPTVRDVFAGEMPWSPRFQLQFDEDDDFDSVPMLDRGWDGDGVRIGQVAAQLAPGEGGSPTYLTRTYDVPSLEFAAKFELRQLPGTLDLVGLDGARASATFRAEKPWSGQLLFVRRDLLEAYAGNRVIIQVAWGEREVTFDWPAVPEWAQDTQMNHGDLWRDVRVLGAE